MFRTLGATVTGLSMLRTRVASQVVGGAAGAHLLPSPDADSSRQSDRMSFPCIERVVVPLCFAAALVAVFHFDSFGACKVAAADVTLDGGFLFLFFTQRFLFR